MATGTLPSISPGHNYLPQHLNILLDGMQASEDHVIGHYKGTDDRWRVVEFTRVGVLLRGKGGWVTAWKCVSLRTVPVLPPKHRRMRYRLLKVTQGD